MDPPPSPPAAADLSLGPVLLSFSLATATFAFSTTFVRFFCAYRAGSGSRRTKYQADDWGSVVATLVALISTCFTLVESTTFSPLRALEYDVLGQPWYLMSVTFSKIAICLFYLGILTSKGKQWRYLLGGLIFVMAVVNLAFALTVNLQCRPLEKMWRGAEVEGACWDPKAQRDFGFFQGAFGVFTWFFLGGFGVVIGGTGLGEEGGRRKGRNGGWEYWGAFGACFASGIFAIVRTARTAQTSGLGVYTLGHSYASLMATLEQNLGLVAANILTFGTLFTSRRRLQQRNPYRSSPSSPGTSRSRSSRKTGKPPLSRGGSITRSITRASSRASSRNSLHSNPTGESVQGHQRQGHSASVSSLGSFRPHNPNDNAHDKYPAAGDDDDDDRRSSDDEDAHFKGGGGEETDLESGNWWPRGIIKTVSVEVVVEEVNVDYYVPGSQDNNETDGGESSTLAAKAAVARNSVLVIPPPKARVKRASVAFDEQTGEGEEMADWEVMIRGGPVR
ncbi:hypothetical protein QBC36DRAFT_303564 [Triangularia setosa]|uniref:Rhodopsin domain-containing protein n=1 Tax=Triangularia setosa TaxID=2587417 RepID=A0AAN7A317_9PEZI|nr:hypothetical protein QBC36DRAFT_303564 [Podospora setosa]